ncbi:MAG: molybdate ABC transporter substrate-binding protein [Granulosicoccaceae bacterium]
MRSVRPSLLALLFLLSLSLNKTVWSTDIVPIRVFAAASLASVLEPIAQDFKAIHSQELLISYGASSTLARQIAYGAPADVFISANPRWMQTLVDAGLVQTEGVQILLHNRLLLVAPPESAFTPTNSLPSAAELEQLLGDKRLAVGDPQHVPVGLYAESALRVAGLWQQVQNKLAPTEDARSTLALLQRNEVPLGIVYRSDLVAVPKLRVISELPLPPGDLINYPIAAIGQNPTEGVQSLLNYLRSPTAKHLFEQQGFDLAN